MQISDDERQEIRTYYGSGGKKKVWRILQKVISEKNAEFQPDGLQQWIKDNTMQYNKDTNKMIQQIESTLKLDFSSKLKEYHGENWLVKGIPAKIYKQANAELGVRNYENAKKGVKQKSAEVKKLKLHGLIEFQILQKILQTAIALQKMSFNM